MQWNWRPISFLICICVWIVGCTNQSDPAPTSTYIPPTHQSTPLPRSATADDDPALTPRLTTPLPFTETVQIVPSGTPSSNTDQISLELIQTTCYESYPGGVLCFGQVHNPNPFPVRNVSVSATLLDHQGGLLRKQDISIGQWVILPDESATYRLLFPPEDRLYLVADFADIQVEITNAEQLIDTDSLLKVKAEVKEAGWVGDQYRISITVQNQDIYDASWMNLNVTLFDRDDRITGFRAIRSNALAAGQTETHEFSINTQVTGQPLTHTIHSEASR